MSSMWASALASLDDSLAVLDATMQQFEAATPVDLAQVTERLRAATESSRELRAFVLSQMPEADWHDRRELNALLEAIDVQCRRSQLLALADKLERGDLTHRRAARVAQLNQLRSRAIEELRSLGASEKTPPNLPGPEADRWVEWAYGLKEPDDTASLQSLRAGFPGLDEFVAALEPGMWVVPSPPQMPTPMPTPAPESAAPVVVVDDLEQRRARLLALATELERGNVVHHRAIRVTQVNQLRDQAIQELRFQALVAREPATLPGPEAEQWVGWACSLEEPEDAEALQSLHDVFVRLDEFVASLEPDMWVPAGPPHPAGVSASAESSREHSYREEFRGETPGREKRHDAAKPIETAAAAPGLASLISLKPGGSLGFSLHLPPRLVSFWRARWRILLPGAVLLLVVLTAMQWQLRRTHASDSPVKSAEAKAPDAAVSASSNSGYNPNVTSAGPSTHTPDLKDKGTKPKDAPAATNPSLAPPQKQVTLLDDTLLRTPQAMPKTPALANAEEAPPNSADSPGPIPGALPGAVPTSLTNIEKDVPAAAPKMPTQKIRVSSGVAQAQLIHQVTPIYPAQAKLGGIRGTVVLQAVVGKDGTVQNIRALRGPPMLIPSAVDAVKQWRYKPFAVNGEPAEADIEITLKFGP